MVASEIYSYLDEKGIDRTLNGYEYLAIAISYGLDKKNINMNEYCLAVAKEFEVPKERVANGISYALKKAPEGCDRKPKLFIRSAHLTLRPKE